MPLSILMNIIISFLIFILTFTISFQTNLFLDAVFRAFVVFIVSFISIFLCTYVIKEIAHKNSSSSTLEDIPEIKNEDTSDLTLNQEASKGGIIDFQTPDDQLEFEPFQPRKLEERDE